MKASTSMLLTLAVGLASCTAGDDFTSPSTSVDSLYRPEPTRPDVGCAEAQLWCRSTEDVGLDQDWGYGRGANVVDVNGDGWDDLFVTDNDGRLRGEDFGVSTFYLNKGDGTFEQADLGISTDDLFAAWGAAFGDYDNDGDPDVLLANGGYLAPSNLALYENRIATHGDFAEVTEPAGIDESATSGVPWWGAAWSDYDDDGHLDFAAVARVGAAVLYRNKGDGTFEEASDRAGIQFRSRDGHNPVWIDYDADGDPDLYLADMLIESRSHKLYRNDNGRFTDVTEEAIGDVFPDAPGVFAAAAADFNQDGLDDLYLGRWTLQDLVLVNQGDGRFRAFGDEIGLDMRTIEGNISFEFVTGPRESENTMGLGVGDLDNDNDPDVVIGTGDPSRANPDIVLCNVLDPASPAGFRFERCALEIVEGNGPTRGHGIVFGDVDRDGDNDIFFNLGGHPQWDQSTGSESREVNAYYEGLSAMAAQTVSITLEGTESNRDAIGALLMLEGDQPRFATIRSSQAFQSQNSARVLFWLGERDDATVRITWPSGVQTRLTVEPGTEVHVSESGDVETRPRPG